MGLLVVMQEILEGLNGLAGLAALINGALLWPVVRALKSTDRSHSRRLGVLEREVASTPLDRKPRKSQGGRTRPRGVGGRKKR